MILGAYAMLFLGLIAAMALTRWHKRKGKASVFAADRTLEEVGFSALMTVGTGTAQAGVDGRLVLRPPFGTRVIGPVIAAIILATFDFAPLFAGTPLDNPNYLRWIGYAAWGLLAWTLYIVNVRQRVIVDGTTLTCQGVQLTHQTRELSGLVDISVHPKRPALVLTFADQPRLYIPKFLTGRDTFVGLMEEIATGNRAAGMTPQREGLFARAGF